MTALKNKKGVLTGLILLVFLGMVAGFYQLQEHQNSTGLFDKNSKPAYQTGKAFEVIEPGKQAYTFSNRTPAQLTGDADQIIARANAIIEKRKLDELEMTAAQRNAVVQRRGEIEEKITELEVILAPL